VTTIGYNSDLSKYGPKTSLTSVTDQWGDYYIARAKAVIDGSWKSMDTWGGFGNGMLKLAPFNALVPEAVRQEANAKIAALSDGTLKPFTGPITDQSGKIRVPAGTAMADKDILEMKWFADGVQGKI
jgi:simple sugar transport system substrate-binding protein